MSPQYPLEVNSFLRARMISAVFNTHANADFTNYGGNVYTTNLLGLLIKSFDKFKYVPHIHQVAGFFFFKLMETYLQNCG